MPTYNTQGNNINELIQQNRQLQEQFQNLMNTGMIGAARPERPAWESMIDQDTGLMQEPYRLEDAYNQQALEGLRQQALRDPGEQSRWRQLMESQVADANAQAQAQTQAAMNQLAMTGGLRSGAAERLAGRGAQAGLQAGQQARMQLDIQDEQNRLQGLQGLNQAELQAAQQAQGVQGQNIERALQDITQKRYADLEAYKEELRQWGSERTAQATPSGGGGKK